MQSGLVAHRAATCNKPAAPTMSAKDLDVMEMLFRWIISRRDWNKLWFLEIANENDPVSEFLSPLRGYDPSPEFLKRFADLPVAIRPASQAKYVKKNLIGIQDRSTGEDGYVATVRILRWIDENTVEVVYTDYHGSEEASGGRGIVRREGGKWVLELKSRWLS